MKKYFLLLALSFFAVACNTEENNTDNNDGKEIPLEPGNSGNKTNKPKAIWIDAHANFSRFATKSAITSYMEKIKDTGFNEIYLDVKPGIGYALYDSDILPKLEKWGTETVTRDWDYLSFWLEEAERLDIDVIASISAMGFGYTKDKQGIIYDDSRWDGKTQVEMKNSDPNNLVDIRNQTDVDAAMLNPCLPEVQTYVISIIEEIVTKYPKLKGFSLDYCRWYGGNYGFSDATIQAFQTYSGETVTTRNDIITSTGGIGRLYNKWIEFRSMTITNLITNISSKIKAINPGIELHLWASADWGSRYSVGQNWASKSYSPAVSSIYTADYSKTGFADQLDVFVLGAYADAVWISENPGSVWSVENFVNTYDNYTKGDCKVYGSIPAYSYDNKATSDAVYLCMKHTDGLMVFEISHVINKNSWSAIKEGINRVEK